MLLTPDFSEVKDSVGPGTYRVRVKAATLDKWETEKGTTPYVNWQLETFGESDAKNNGRTVFHKTPIKGGGAFKLADLYKAATGQILNPKAPSFDTDMLLGREVEIEVIDGMRNGQPTGYTEIKRVRSLAGAAAN